MFNQKNFKTEGHLSSLKKQIFFLELTECITSFLERFFRTD